MEAEKDALLASLSLRDALVIAQPLGPQMKMRIGINLGPVKLVKDINSHPNIIGDGINVAQRVMSFAAPGQILVSRSFHEVVSRMSDDYDLLFHYEGSRTDKHVREHEVYAVQPGVPINRRASRRRELSQSQGKPVLDRLTGSASSIASGLRHSPHVSTALAVVAILAVAVGIRLQREPAAPVATPAANSPKVAARSSAPTKTAPEPAVKTVTDVPSGKNSGGNAPARQAVASPAESKPPASKGQGSTGSAKQSAAGGSGKLALTVTPWGEVYVDGRHLGTTPPLYEVPLGAGSHRLEIRHPDFPAHVRTVEIQAGRRVSVTHWFQPKEQPNPIDSLRRLWK